MSETFTFCPYCDARVMPGQQVVHVEDPDPFRTLWHQRCRDMWSHDERLAEAMRSKAPGWGGET